MYFIRGSFKAIVSAVLIIPASFSRASVLANDEPRHILDRANKIEKALMEMVWDDSASMDTEKKAAVVDFDEIGIEDYVERGTIEEPRKINLLMPISSACTLAVTILATGSG